MNVVRGLQTKELPNLFIFLSVLTLGTCRCVYTIFDIYMYIFCMRVVVQSSWKLHWFIDQSLLRKIRVAYLKGRREYDF